jgi:hypothetical protein
VNITTHTDATDDFTVNATGIVYEGDTGEVGIGIADPQAKLWVEGGDETVVINSDAGSSTLYFRNTIDANDATILSNLGLDFQTGGTNSRMFIKSTGEVGVGTSTPISPLDVGNVTGNYGTIGVVSDTNHKALNVEENSGGESWQIGVNADGDLGFIDSNAVFTSASVVMQDGGNVGIGTTTPDGKVNIFSADSGATANGGADELVIENSSSAGMSILSPDANDSLIYWGSPTDAIGASAFWNYDAKLFALGSSTASGEVSIRSGDSAEAIRIDDSGQVGIGTTTPDGDLHVYGGDAAQGRIRLEGGEAQSARFIMNPDQADDNADSVQIEVTDGGLFSIESFSTGAWVNSMVIDSSGNVGIGATSPGEELHVVDSSSSTNVIRYTTIFDAETDADMADGFGAGIRFQATDSGASGEFARIAGIRDGGDNEGALVLLAGTGGAEEFMRIDNAGNVGIGTNNPVAKLDILTPIDGVGLRLINPNFSVNGQYTFLSIGKDTSTSGFHLIYSHNTTADDRTVTLGTSEGWNTGEGLTIKGDGQVGIGTTTPTSELQVDASGGGIIQATRTNTGFSFVANSFLSGLEFGGEDSDSGTDNDASAIYSYADGTWTNSSHPTHMRFATTTSGGTSSSEKMRIDNAGNVGIGNSSLETWTANYSVLQLGGNASLWSNTAAGAGSEFNMLQNAYNNSGWKYQDTDEASLYYQTNGAHNFLVADSGTADTAITWTEAMKIDVDGNVGIGTTDPDTILDINGALTGRELSADPSDPDEGSYALWMSDGTGSGDDGDVMIKITAGATTKTITLVDFSAF